MRSFALSCCLALALLPATALATESQAPALHVVGEGEVFVVPDRAQLSLAAEQVEAELGSAESRVNDIVRRYLEAASALGIEPRHLQSTSVQIQPETVWNEQTRRNELVGYRVRRDIRVTVMDLSQLGALLTAATSAGITQVSPPQLEASDAMVHERAALAQAAEDATAQARVLAASLGRRLGPPRRVDTQGAVGAPPMPMAFAMMKTDQSEHLPASMGLSTGEIRFHRQVSVVFDLLAP